MRGQCGGAGQCGAGRYGSGGGMGCERAGVRTGGSVWLRWLRVAVRGRTQLRRLGGAVRSLGAAVHSCGETGMVQNGSFEDGRRWN